MPKAPSYATYDEDEKTTIESGGWEEEASTTVEQGEVAEKVRALGLHAEQAARLNTAITATSGQSMADEPTVDDQRGAAALAVLAPPNLARLEVTQGNDTGQAIEVRPGKTYTIGRAIDNDLVLTDMTVSRKHFDLRHERGAWVLADRGSGNGTLVNDRLEDAPFVLANGDVIEIGNTTFRFEFPNGLPRVQSRFTASADDDAELSTMSGKPVRDPEPATPAQLVPPVGRPKTLPPPAPLPRTRPSTHRPSGPLSQSHPQQPAPVAQQPIAAALLAAANAPTISPVQAVPGLHHPSPAPPATTLPLPQMANRPPLQPAILPATLIEAPLVLQTTIPGQGPPMQPAHPARLPFSYPVSTDIPTLRPRGSRAMAVVSTLPPRDATSTALVPPISYANGPPAVAPSPAYPVPQLSRRVRMGLAAVGVALFAAIATIAILKGTRSNARRETADGNGQSAVAPAVDPRGDPAAVRPGEPRPTPTITPIVPPPTAPSPSTSPAPKAAPPPPKAAPPPPRAAPPPPKAAPPSTATPPAATSPPRAAATAVPPSGVATSVAPAPARTDKAAAPPVVARAERTEPSTPPRADKKPVRRPDRKPDRKPAPARFEAARIEVDRERADATRAEPPAPSRPDRRTAGRTLPDVKNDAAALYRAKNFSGASAILTQSLPSFSGDDVKDLKSLAAIYTQLGKAYAVGMAPATKATEAYTALRRAINYDRDVGSAYVAEMEERLAVVASRAAVLYMAAKDYEAAFQAVRQSEALGGNGSQSSSNKLVRDKLLSVASELLAAATSEMASNPEEAKRKAHQVQAIVDSKSPLYAKAARLLSGS